MSEEEVAVAQPEAAPAFGEPMDINMALPLVVRKSKAHGGLARGLHEAAKAIEKPNTHLCITADDCDQPDYVKLVKAFCADHNVKLLHAPSSKTLGKWAGLGKIDSEGKARKVVGCSCVVVEDCGGQHEAVEIFSSTRIKRSWDSFILQNQGYFSGSSMIFDGKQRISMPENVYIF